MPQNPVHAILPFERWAKTAWPLKPSQNLRAITRRSPRTIKYQLAGRELRYRDIVAILRSDYGYSLLQHIMGDAQPTWWRGVAKARGLASLRKDIAAAQRRIAQIELEFD